MRSRSYRAWAFLAGFTKKSSSSISGKTFGSRIKGCRGVFTDATFNGRDKGMERLAYIVPSFLREFFLKPHLWSLLGLCLAFVFCFSPARALRGPHSVFLWIAFFYGIFIVLIYLITPWQIEQIIPLSLTRLLMPLAPITTLWMLFQIKETNLLPEEWIMG